MMRRRDLLRRGACATAVLLARSIGVRRLLAAPAQAAAAPSPRWVIVFLSGGLDSLLTTDPKERKDVEPWVDLPYKPASIVETCGTRVGPLFAPVAHHVPKMAVVNGVQVNTANHQSGRLHFYGMRTGALNSAPTLAELLGALRDADVPLAVASTELLRDDFDRLTTASKSRRRGARARAALPGRSPRHGLAGGPRARRRRATRMPLASTTSSGARSRIEQRSGSFDRARAT
jgi:hypothetical protein